MPTAALRSVLFGRGTDPSAAAYFDAVAGGGTLDATHKNAINTLIVGLKAAGIWTKFDRLWLLANQHSVAALTDLKALTVATATSTFTADRGYAGNGSTTYINTGFQPSTHGVTYTLNAAHLSVYNRTNRTDASAFCDIGGGSFGGASAADIFASLANATYMQIADDAVSVAAAASAQGFWLGNRSASNAKQFYKNGASLAADTTTAAGSIAANNIFIGAFNQAGAGSNVSSDQHAAASAGGSLTAGEVASYTTLLEACLDAFGAGVL